MVCWEIFLMHNVLLLMILRIPFFGPCFGLSIGTISVPAYFGILFIYIPHKITNNQSQYSITQTENHY